MVVGEPLLLRRGASSLLESMRQESSRLFYPEPPLRDEMIVLRRWEESDLTCVREASLDPYICEITSVPATFTVAEGLAWIDRQWRRLDNGEGLSQAIADVDSGEAVGAVVLMLQKQPQTAEIGYWVVDRARGRGFARRAVALLAGWAVGSAGFARVEAFVEPANVSSQRVLEKAGFRREGNLRSYLVFDRRRADALIYSLLSTDVA
jgi:[ribosomal protein S5]-alanine N-acetyltransferase